MFLKGFRKKGDFFIYRIFIQLDNACLLEVLCENFGPQVWIKVEKFKFFWRVGKLKIGIIFDFWRYNLEIVKVL